MKPAKSKKTPLPPAASAAAAPGRFSAPPQELVAERARSLWEQRGRPSDQDLEIWLEAERQLGGRPGVKDSLQPQIDQTEPGESLTSEVEHEMDAETSSGAPRRSATSL